MDTQYFSDAGQTYNKTDDLICYRRWAEFPSFLNAAGALEGTRVLNAACGTGIISRLFKKGDRYFSALTSLT